MAKNAKAVETTNEAADVPAVAVAGGAMIDLSKYKLKTVHMKARALRDGEQIIVKCDSEVIEGKPIKGDGSKYKDAAQLVNVTNVQTGECFALITGKVLASILTDEAGGKIEGRMFAVERFAPAQGKTYPTYTVRELVEG